MIASTINTDYIELIVEANVVNGVTVSDAVIDPNNPYRLTLNATAANEISEIELNVTPNTTYTLSIPDVNSTASLGRVYIYYDGVVKHTTFVNSKTFTTEATTSKVRISVFSNGAGTFTFTDPQLEQGTVANVFEPQDVYTVGVTFTGKRGVPDDLEGIRTAIRNILPAHLALILIMTYLSWQEMEDNNVLWNDLETFTWDELEKASF
jgi:hypothetical protein